MTYQVLLGDQPREFLDSADEKTYRICRQNLLKLEDGPYPGGGKGDKERLLVDGEERYRLHIGRTHTAFYDIEESSREVLIHEITDIDTAHKRYGVGR
ncbi:type II toxin-antitoxin system RelE family toxin [Halococcus thailandensis]|uniref:type II toxin-antitoxin system RelE family toxin n=1 Tax=Halococcus thailandensis TaxID=335952 RepID=UPI0009B5C169|nr:plasmid stabilization protein [Halococcus thailandensis]